MNRAYGILGLILVALIGVGMATRLLGHSDDKTMIQESLRQSLEASRKGEAGGVLEALSSRLKVNDQDAGGNQSMIANYIKNQRPDISVTNQNPIVTGDEARIISPVKIRISLPIVGDKTVTVKDVVLVFHKESGREYLIFPVAKWRLAEVQAPPMDLNALGIE